MRPINGYPIGNVGRNAIKGGPVSLVVKKSLALAAFVLMMLSLVVTLVRPRIPGAAVTGAELMGIVMQIVLAGAAFRYYRKIKRTTQDSGR